MKCLNLKSYTNCFVFVKCVVDYKLTPFLTFFLGSWGVNVLIPEQQINQWWSHFLSGRGSFSIQNCGRYSEILNRFFSKENDMLSRSSALKGQFCLPEKEKCKGQVNNLRISYTFCWGKKKINILFMCYQFISGSWEVFPLSFNLAVWEVFGTDLSPSLCICWLY